MIDFGSCDQLDRAFEAMARFDSRKLHAAMKKLAEPRCSTTVRNEMPEAGGGAPLSVSIDDSCDSGTTSSSAPTAASDDDDGGGGDPDPEPERSSPSQHPSPALLSCLAVTGRCDLSRSRVYSLVKQGQFPPPVKIGRSSRWVASEVDAWIASRIRDRATTTTG